MDFVEYFRNKNLRKTPHVGVHYEQKTTPDLLWCISLVILDVTKDNRNLFFSDGDIRLSPVFDNLMQDYFSKPPQHLAENEYNKVSSYQLSLLSYAGVLKQVSRGPKKYKIDNLEALEYMALNDLNASKFLTEYTEKFLNDNDLLEIFTAYKNNPTQENHLLAKEAYWQWARVNTSVRGSSRDHTYRVFNKIFNVFCYKNRIPGEDASNIMAGPCPYSFLIYNRENFRDKDMPSGMTRQQYYEEVISEINDGGVVETLLQKVKDSVKAKHNNDSEIQDPSLGYLPNSGVHIHHILPRRSYSQYSLAKENLIALTPGQHLSLAHVAANTGSISPDFQRVCFKKKFEHIRASLDAGDGFYDLREFVKILNTRFNQTLGEDTNAQQIERFLTTI